eukprot:SAG31_NODE_31840_length_363_cov_0.977273_1_plen_26_part_01
MGSRSVRAMVLIELKIVDDFQRRKGR